MVSDTQYSIFCQLDLSHISYVKVSILYVQEVLIHFLNLVILWVKTTGHTVPYLNCRARRQPGRNKKCPSFKVSTNSMVLQQVP